jgi:AcrR family transcriptional regulator
MATRPPRKKSTRRDASPPGTRQPRGRARRSAVLQVARRLFALHGFRGASLAEMAREAGITDAGLLYHFPTKRQLLLAVIEQGDSEQDAALARVPDATGMAFLQRMATFGEDLEADPVLTALDVTLSAEHMQDHSAANRYFRSRYERFRAQVARAFADARDRGALSRDVDPEAEAQLLIAVLDGLRLQWILSEGRVSLADGMNRYMRGVMVRLKKR